MAQIDNLKTVRLWFKALAENDFEAMHSHHTETIIWELMPGPAEGVVPWTGRFFGRSGVEQCLRGYSTVQSEKFVIENPLTREDGTITVPGYSNYLVKATGAKFTIEFVEYIRCVDGKIDYVKVYGDTADAMRALSSK